MPARLQVIFRSNIYEEYLCSDEFLIWQEKEEDKDNEIRTAAGFVLCWNAVPNTHIACTLNMGALAWVSFW